MTSRDVGARIRASWETNCPGCAQRRRLLKTACCDYKMLVDWVRFATGNSGPPNRRKGRTWGSGNDRALVSPGGRHQFVYFRRQGTDHRFKIIRGFDFVRQYVGRTSEKVGPLVGQVEKSRRKGPAKGAGDDHFHAGFLAKKARSL